MSTSMSLRKTGSHIHLSYASTFSNNLTATDFRIETSPDFKLIFDLNNNLRTRNKQKNNYEDARDLADGKINKLELVQIDDDQVIARLEECIERLDKPPQTWKLTIHLEGEHTFSVEQEAKRIGNSTSLILRVIKKQD